MKAGDDTSLCNVNAEYSIYGHEGKTSTLSSQLQPQRYRGGEPAPEPRSSSSDTGVWGFHCYQGQICTRLLNLPLLAFLWERSLWKVILGLQWSGKPCSSGLCPTASGVGRAIEKHVGAASQLQLREAPLLPSRPSFPLHESELHPVSSPVLLSELTWMC